MNFDKDLTRKMRVQIWASGISLGMSWKKFAAPHQIRQQMERAGTPQSPMLIELMLGDIFSLISESHLVALGYRVEPSVSDGPVLVPADSFTIGLEFPSAFERDEVTASGWKYERITLLKREDFLSIIDEIQKIENEVSQVAIGRGDEVAGTEKPKMGRPNIQDKILAVIKILDSENAINSALPVKAIGEIIRTRGKHIYPDHFIVKDGKVKPGRSTIEKAYNKYRLK